MSKLNLKDFKPKDIDFSYQKVVSYSAYSVYKHCPFKWYLQYHKKDLPYEPSISTIFGTAMHNVLQMYIKTAYTESFTKADDIDMFELLQDKISEEYKIQFIKNKNVHFSNPTELNEYREDGEAILKWFSSHRMEYPSKKGWELVGIEMPIQKEVKHNLLFQGYLDIVLYNSIEDKILIIDLKTSKQSWGDYHKKDKTKQHQLMMYKHYFAELYGHPIKNIDVKFLILKRKLYENLDFAQKRIQEFIPPNGKNSVNQAVTSFDEFLAECYDSNGKTIEKEYTKQPGKLCDYCKAFEKNLCDKNQNQTK